MSYDFEKCPRCGQDYDPYLNKDHVRTCEGSGDGFIATYMAAQSVAPLQSVPPSLRALPPVQVRRKRANTNKGHQPKKERNRK